MLECQNQYVVIIRSCLWSCDNVEQLQHMSNKCQQHLHPTMHHLSAAQRTDIISLLTSGHSAHKISSLTGILYTPAPSPDCAEITVPPFPSHLEADQPSSHAGMPSIPYTSSPLARQIQLLMSPEHFRRLLMGPSQHRQQKDT